MQYVRLIGEKNVVVRPRQLDDPYLRNSVSHVFFPTIDVDSVRSVYLLKCEALFFVLRLKPIEVRPMANDWPGNSKKCKDRDSNLGIISLLRTLIYSFPNEAWSSVRPNRPIRILIVHITKLRFRKYETDRLL